MGDHLPPSEDGEVWLPVVGFEGLYEVSNHGRVWSVLRLSRAGCWIGESCSLRARTRGVTGRSAYTARTSSTCLLFSSSWREPSAT